MGQRTFQHRGWAIGERRQGRPRTLESKSFGKPPPNECTRRSFDGGRLVSGFPSPNVFILVVFGSIRHAPASFYRAGWFDFCSCSSPLMIVKVLRKTVEYRVRKHSFPNMLDRSSIEVPDKHPSFHFLGPVFRNILSCIGSVVRLPDIHHIFIRKYQRPAHELRTSQVPFP